MSCVSRQSQEHLLTELESPLHRNAERKSRRPLQVRPKRRDVPALLPPVAKASTFPLLFYPPLQERDAFKWFRMLSSFFCFPLHLEPLHDNGGRGSSLFAAANRRRGQQGVSRKKERAKDGLTPLHTAATPYCPGLRRWMRVTTIRQPEDPMGWRSNKTGRSASGARKQGVEKKGRTYVSKSDSTTVDLEKRKSR